MSGAVAELQSDAPPLHVYEHFVPLHVAAEALVRLHLSPHALQLLVVSSSVQMAGGPAQLGSWHEQTPLWQSGVGCAHGPHVAPAVPHDVSDWLVYATHAPALQQPFGQEVASHTHLPVDRLHS